MHNTLATQAVLLLIFYFFSTAEALQREQQQEKEKLEKEKGNQLLSFAHFLYTRLYVRLGASLSDV